MKWRLHAVPKPMGQTSAFTTTNNNNLGVSLSDMPREEFKITDWQPREKNTLRSVFTLETPSGYVIHGCMLHEKGDSRWIGLPAQKYSKADGSVAYTRIIELRSREVSDRFQEAALAAVDQYLRGAR